MAKLDFTAAQVNKAIAYRMTPISEDVVDGVYVTGSERAIVADTEYRLTFDSANYARHATNGFSGLTGITSLYDSTNDVFSYSDVQDTATVMALPNCWFTPSAANAGECLIRMYVNETSPILHDQAIVNYQGTTSEKMGDIFMWYLGDETGYQIKSKGVYFTFEFEHNGTMVDQGMFHCII